MALSPLSPSKLNIERISNWFGQGSPASPKSAVLLEQRRRTESKSGSRSRSRSKRRGSGGNDDIDDSSGSDDSKDDICGVESGAAGAAGAGAGAATVERDRDNVADVNTTNSTNTTSTAAIAPVAATTASNANKPFDTTTASSTDNKSINAGISISNVTMQDPSWRESSSSPFLEDIDQENVAPEVTESSSLHSAGMTKVKTATITATATATGMMGTEIVGVEKKTNTPTRRK